MVYTQHGHQIPGTPVLGEPALKARCGGPRLCSLCSRDVSVYHIEQEDRVSPSDFERELSRLLNKYSYDSATNMPDFVLASYLSGMLDNLRNAKKATDRWMGK